MDTDLQTLHKAEKLDHLDLYRYEHLSDETAKEVSDAADRVVARHHARMIGMSTRERIAVASTPTHPVEASVAKGALMLVLIEEQTTRRRNQSVDLQSVYDNVTELLGDSHFFEILEQSAEACALAVFCQTAAIATGAGGYSGFEVTSAPHGKTIDSLMRKHGLYEGEEVILSRGGLRSEHVSMLEQVLRSIS